MMREVYSVLLSMIAAGPASLRMKTLAAEVFADDLTYSITADSDQNAQSQDAGARGKPDESLLILRSTVREVHLVFTVTDKHGRYIRGLKQDDFKILDDRKPPKEILSFHSETDLPLQVGLLIDTSQSVRDRFKFEQEAAIEFLSQTMRPKHDQAFVMGFSLKPEVAQDFTDDREKLSAGIHMLQLGNLTAVYDAVYYACRDRLTMKQKGSCSKALRPAPGEAEPLSFSATLSS